MVTKKGGVKKVDRKHIAIMMEMTHGGFFDKHTHYHTVVMEVNSDEVDMQIQRVRKAATNALKTASLIGIGGGKVLSVEQIEITTMEDAQAKDAAFRSLIKH